MDSAEGRKGRLIITDKGSDNQILVYKQCPECKTFGFFEMKLETPIRSINFESIKNDDDFDFIIECDSCGGNIHPTDEDIIYFKSEHPLWHL